MELPVPASVARACSGDETQQQIVRRLLMRDTSPLDTPLDATPPAMSTTPFDPPPLPTKDRSGRRLTTTALATLIARNEALLTVARENGMRAIREARAVDVDRDLYCEACGTARAPQPAVEIRCGTCGRLLDTPSWLGRPGENGAAIHNFHRRPVEEKPLHEAGNGAVSTGPTAPTTTSRRSNK